ncbi:MAG: HAD-IB family hydrolase [Salinivirgaceae bacterium]
MSYFAFFDIDHTILKINSGEVLLRMAHKKGLLSNRKLISAYFLSVLYRLKLIDSARILEKFASWLANYPVSEMENLCPEIVEKYLIPAIRPQIMAEIKRHQAQGAHLVVLSSAIAPICNPIAKYLEIPTVICTELEAVNQHYTGFAKGKFCYRNVKLNRMIQLLDANKSFLENSYYYGDSMDDLSVLHSVGYPVCVNPDKYLIKIAQHHNWEIRTWD